MFHAVHWSGFAIQTNGVQGFVFRNNNLLVAFLVELDGLGGFDAGNVGCGEQ